MDVYENAVKCVEKLGLPHSTHTHIEGYENEIGKRNLITVLEKIKSLNINTNQNSNSDLNGNQILHIAHANSYNFDGNKLILSSPPFIWRGIQYTSVLVWERV